MVPDSYRDVEERLDVSEFTIRKAEQHVAAIERYPELASLPRITATHTAKALDSAALSNVPIHSRQRTITAVGRAQSIMPVDTFASQQPSYAACMMLPLIPHIFPLPLPGSSWAFPHVPSEIG